jgi:hypothetical protein
MSVLTVSNMAAENTGVGSRNPEGKIPIVCRSRGDKARVMVEIEN